MQYILDFIQRFPSCNEQDLVKVLYQRVFGAAHLLEDRVAAFQSLQKEWKGRTNTQIKEDFIQISDDMLWVNLRAVNDLDAFFAHFVSSAEQTKGSQADYAKLIEQLIQLIQERDLPYDVSAIAAMAATRHTYHHSLDFANKYQPHYRLLLKKFVR